MSKKWRLTDRTRTLLTLELAMVLPAAALMAFSIYNLKHIQHSEAIQAVLQRELNNVLRYAQKKSWEKGYNMLLPIREEFPDPGDRSAIKAKLERILSDHPEFSYAALYDKKTDMLVTSMQPGHTDAIICGYTQDEMDMLAKWLPLQSPHMVRELRKMEDSEHELVMFYGEWNPKQHAYWNVAYFIPPDVPKDRDVLGLVAFDPDYLRKTFLPALMKDVLTSKSGMKADDAQSPVIMIHPTKDDTPWVTSGNWDGRKPEAERPLQWFLDDLTIAIKYHGTTVAQIGNRILRFDYLILGALSGLMIGGIWLTYRNISREMKLARLKSDFVANVSHELRTPLTVVMGFLEHLIGQEGEAPMPEETRQHFLTMVQDQVGRMNRLVDDLLTLSRLENTPQLQNEETVDIHTLANQVLVESQALSKGRHEIHLECGNARLKGNLFELRSAFSNLVGNAVRYTPEGGTVTLRWGMEEGLPVFSVTDTGIGIAAEHIPRLTERFYRVDKGRSASTGGTGLGLAIVKHVLQHHQATLDIRSNQGEGSTFRAVFPLARLVPLP